MFFLYNHSIMMNYVFIHKFVQLERSQMACRVIADFTFKEGWCEKIRAMLEDGKNGLNLTANFEGCIDIDMDNPNRMILT